jgi:hypothetical protein
MDRLQNLYPSVDYECLRQIYSSCSQNVEAASISLQTMGFTPSVDCQSAHAHLGDPHDSYDLDMQLALALSADRGFLDHGAGAAVHVHHAPAADLRAVSDFRAVRAIAKQPTDAAGSIPPGVIEAATFRFRHVSPADDSADAAADDAADAAAGGGRGCDVCLAALRGGDECRRLPCLHAFHVACIDGWLARSRLCPVCKADVAAAAVARV